MKYFRKFRSVVSVIAAAACVIGLLSPEAVLASGSPSDLEITGSEVLWDAGIQTETDDSEFPSSDAGPVSGAEAAESRQVTVETAKSMGAEAAEARQETVETAESMGAEAAEARQETVETADSAGVDAAETAESSGAENAVQADDSAQQTAGTRTNEADSAADEVSSDTALQADREYDEADIESLWETEEETEELTGASPFEYVSVDGGVSVTGYTGSATNITIPSSIDGYAVVSVGEEAFRQTGITSVTLPATLTSLGTNCFCGCESLSSVNLGSCGKLQTIGEGSFSLCKSLTTVRIPDSVTVIGSDAFFCCSRLADVTIGSKVKVIEMYAFGMCGKLTSIKLPASVKTVEMHAFSQCEGLSSIDLGSVNTIGDYAFAFAAPTTLSIPATCSSVGAGAFHDCEELTKVSLQEGTVKIGRTAFANCPGLSSQIIPNSVTQIGDGAFGCNWGWESESVVGASAAMNGASGALSKAEDPELWAEELKSFVSEETVGSGEYITPRSGFTITAYRTDSPARAYASKYGFTFKCLSKSISDTEISGIKSSYNYTGKAQKPAPTVRDGDITLKAGTDYTAAYSGNTNLGTATITLTGKGNYKGTIKKTFKIVAYPIYGARITAKTASATYAYTGNARKPGVTVTFNGTRLTAGTDYTLAYKNNTNPGTATITLTGRGRFRLTREITFKLALAVPTVTGAVRKSSGKLQVTWKKYNLARGYQVRVARGEISKIYTCGGTSTLSKTVSGLTAGKTWRVYVRSYRKIGTKYYYSGWSDVKYVKV